MSRVSRLGGQRVPSRSQRSRARVRSETRRRSSDVCRIGWCQCDREPVTGTNWIGRFPLHQCPARFGASPVHGHSQVPFLIRSHGHGALHCHCDLTGSWVTWGRIIGSHRRIMASSSWSGEDPTWAIGGVPVREPRVERCDREQSEARLTVDQGWQRRHPHLGFGGPTRHDDNPGHPTFLCAGHVGE